MGRSLKIAAFMAVIFISVFMLSLSAPAFAEGLTVNFYLDREDPAPFASVEITDGSLTVPEAIPEREGYTFDGWSGEIPATMPDEDIVFYGTLTRSPVLREIIANDKTPLAAPTWSLLNLILSYNGLGRITGNEVGSVGGGKSAASADSA